MIDLIYHLGTEHVFVRVQGTSILFSNTLQANQMADISGLKLSYQGVIKEFPDLKERTDWKDEAIRRFKTHIRELPDEPRRAEYITHELTKYGYKLAYRQRQGSRVEKFV